MAVFAVFDSITSISELSTADGKREIGCDSFSGSCTGVYVPTAGGLDASKLLPEISEACRVSSYTDRRLEDSARTSARGRFTASEAALRFDLGDSNRPYRGRGGRSGVPLPVAGSEIDAERLRNLDAASRSSSTVEEGSASAVVFNATIDSLMLRLCCGGRAGVFRGKFVSKLPKVTRSPECG